MACAALAWDTLSLTMKPLSPAWKWILFFVACAVLLTRRMELIFIPQFFAEDGSVFFPQSMDMGWRAVFTPCAGYILLLPRLVAGATTWVPWLYLPLVYNLAGMIVTAFVVVRVASSRLPRVAAVAGAVALLVVPFNGVIYSCLNSLHFILGALLVVNLLEPAPASRSETVRRLIEVVLASLSGPEGIILLPWVAWRALQLRKSPRGLILMGGIAITALIQLGVLLLSHNRDANCLIVRDDVFSVAKTGEFELPPVSIISRYITCFFCRWAGLPTKLLGIEWVALVGAAILFTPLLWGCGRKHLQVVFLLLAASGAFLMAGRYANPVWMRPYSGDCQARFIFFPYVLAFWSLGWIAASPGLWRQRVAYALIGLVCISSLTRWQADSLGNYRWGEQLAEHRATHSLYFFYPCTPAFPQCARAPKHDER